MGHIGNWSERKHASVEAAERAKRAHGWWRAGPRDAWAAVDNPGGVLARGARLTASCGSHDCNRRVRFDPRFWIERGMGEVQISVIQAAYMCARTPCGLRWQTESFPEGVPIIGYDRTEGAEVTLRCRPCGRCKRYTVRQFVDRLLAAGRSPNVPAWALHRCVQGACPSCGARGLSVTLSVDGVLVKAPPGVE